MALFHAISEVALSPSLVSSWSKGLLVGAASGRGNLSNKYGGFINDDGALTCFKKRRLNQGSWCFNQCFDREKVVGTWGIDPVNILGQAATGMMDEFHYERPNCHLSLEGWLVLPLYIYIVY